MKILYPFCAFFFAINPIFADNCYDSLTKDGDSKFFLVDLSNDLVDSPNKAVEKILQNNCTNFTFKVTHNACRRIRADDPTTHVCYLETIYGDFVLFKNPQDVWNVVFNRKD